MLLKLAWRNIWRQQRRTLLTAAALALALILSLLMRAIQEGSYSASIDNIARLSTGLIQLQHPDFKDSQSIDDLLPSNASFIAYARQHSAITAVLPRIESFALAASANKSKGVLVLGVDPQPEDDYNGLADRIVEGHYFTATTDTAAQLPELKQQQKIKKPQVLIAQGLADQLQLELSDELVLYGQGYHGQTAAGLFHIQGILYFPMAELNNQLVYLPLANAQHFYSTADLISNWVLHTQDLDAVTPTVTDLRQHYVNQHHANKQISTPQPDETVVRDWLDLSPDLAQQIKLDRVSGLLLMYLLYGIVGFGLFATLLMMTLERQREFAVMLATGLQRYKLLQLIAIESLFIAIIGTIMGLVIAIPILIWLYFNPITLTGDTATMMLEMGYEPIIPVLLTVPLFINQIAIILMLLAICLLYPLWRSYHINLVSALQGGAHAS